MKKKMADMDWHIVRMDNLPADIQLGKLSDEELLGIMKQCHYDRNKACYIASDDFISREIAGELVLIPMDDLGENGMVTFNETGTYLWKLLQEKRTSGDLAYALRQEFNVTDEIAAEDVQRFLDSACSCGMVKKVQ